MNIFSLIILLSCFFFALFFIAFCLTEHPLLHNWIPTKIKKWIQLYQLMVIRIFIWFIVCLIPLKFKQMYLLLIEFCYQELDVIILISVVLAYGFSTKEEDPLDSILVVFLLKILIRVLLGVFVVMLLARRLLHLGQDLKPVAILFESFRILEFVLFIFSRIEMILWSVTPVFSDLLVYMFGTGFQYYAILLVDIIIVFILLYLLWVLWFKPRF